MFRQQPLEGCESREVTRVGVDLPLLVTVTTGVQAEPCQH